MGNIGPGEILVVCLIAGIVVGAPTWGAHLSRALRGAKRDADLLLHAEPLFSYDSASSRAWVARACTVYAVVLLVAGATLALRAHSVASVREARWTLAVSALVGLVALVVWFFTRVTVRVFRGGVELGRGPKRRWIARSMVRRVDDARGELVAELRSGERVRLAPSFAVLPSNRRRIVELVRSTIEPAPDRPVAPDAPAREETERMLLDWLASLPRGAGLDAFAALGEGAERGYRDAALPREELWSHLEAPDASSRTRAVAAAALLGREPAASDRARVFGVVSGLTRGPLRVALTALVTGDEATFLRALSRLDLRPAVERGRAGDPRSLRWRTRVGQVAAAAVGSGLAILPLLSGHPLASFPDPAAARDVACIPAPAGRARAGARVEPQAMGSRGHVATQTMERNGSLGAYSLFVVEVEETSNEGRPPIPHVVGEACDVRFDDRPDVAYFGRVSKSESVPADPAARRVASTKYDVLLDPKANADSKLGMGARVRCGYERPVPAAPPPATSPPPPG